MKKTISLILVLVLWAGLAASAWFGPAAEFSDAERRPLEQFPAVTGKDLLSGQFMKDFADYAVDQFPLRDGFRTLNAYLTYYLLGQTDNNGIYLSDGYAAKMEYPLNESSIGNAVARFTELYDMYLSGSEIRFALVPDKSFYLAEEAGALAMDYDALYERMAEELPWAELIDLREYLTIEDYYRTDTHWRQERILDAAGKLCEALTDSLRAERLRAAGYSVTVCELTDPENTPKNTLIRAIKKPCSAAELERRRAEYDAALAFIMGEGAKNYLQEI